jgi:hypothetical protein
VVRQFRDGRVLEDVTGIGSKGCFIHHAHLPRDTRASLGRRLGGVLD